MQYTKLGRAGLDVSPICIGCMGFGDPSRGYPGWSLDEEASRSLIKHTLEAGSTSSTPPTCTPRAGARRSWAGR